MQVMVVEFARHVLGLTDADSTEMDQATSNPVISLLEEQRIITDRGGTMRLGAYPCNIKEGTKAATAYKQSQISEIHRHRYEFNNKFLDQFEDAGLTISGTYAEGNLSEIVEVANHPWMVGVQFHPEFCSKPTEPHPLFSDFVKAMIESKPIKNL
jgi:CTP synthase